MLKNYPLKSFVKYSLLAAILYLIPATIFILHTKFSGIWLLYLGNMLFLIAMFGFMITYRPPTDKNTSKMYMLGSGHIVMAMGVIISLILVTIIVLVLKPAFYPESVVRNITDAPPSTNGLTFSLYMDAIFGNVSAGSFASIIMSYGSRSKYRQTPEV